MAFIERAEFFAAVDEYNFQHKALPWDCIPLDTIWKITHLVEKKVKFGAAWLADIVDATGEKRKTFVPSLMSRRIEEQWEEGYVIYFISLGQEVQGSKTFNLFDIHFKRQDDALKHEELFVPLVSSP